MITHRDLYTYLAKPCVSFIYRRRPEEPTRIWAGAFISPIQIATVTHAFAISIQPVMAPEIPLENVEICDVDGTTYRITKTQFYPNDVCVVTVNREGPAWFYIGDPRLVREGELVYMWGYPISYEGMQRQVHLDSGRFPYWGAWVVGWWEGPAVPESPYAYKILCPSAKGQSGSPVIAFQEGMPKIVGVLSATFSTLEGGTLLDQSYSYIATLDVLKESITEQKTSPVSYWVTKAKPYIIPALIGAALGIILTRR